MYVGGDRQPLPGFPFETNVPVSHIVVKWHCRSLGLKVWGSRNVWEGGKGVLSCCLPRCTLGGEIEMEITGKD